VGIEDEVRKVFGDIKFTSGIQVSKVMEVLIKNVEINTLKKLRSEIDKHIKKLEAQIQAGSLDPYSILGVSQNATQEEVKNAYQRKAFEVHPDRNPGKEKWANEEMAKVNAAYQVICKIRGW